jgi:hypothetical protein
MYHWMASSPRDDHSKHTIRGNIGIWGEGGDVDNDVVICCTRHHQNIKRGELQAPQIKQDETHEEF